MTRVGWVFVAVVAAIVAAFASMTRFGGPPPAGSSRARAIAAFHRFTHPEQVGDGAPGLLAVPVAGYPRAAIEDNWGDARGDGTRAHHGTDIMAPGGARVIAAAPGTVEKLFLSRLGGITLYVRSVDRRWTYYYAHLAGYAPGLHEGQVVRTGDPLGFVGDTGDAGPGNYHLHFGLERLDPTQRWWQGEEVNPYPSLAGKPGRR